MIPLLLAIGLLSVFDAQDVNHASPIEIMSGIGSCAGNGRQVDLRHVAFLENRSIDFDQGQGMMRVSIEEETVYVRSLASGSTSPTNYYDIGLTVQQNGDADVDLKLGLLDGELVIFWRETFQHRMYRQGLFRPEATRLTPICEGRGGFDRSE
jgi:hypothetical protein